MLVIIAEGTLLKSFIFFTNLRLLVSKQEAQKSSLSFLE